VPRPPRVLSVDLLRGLDVLLMLFVNEMAGVTGTPAFLLHVPAYADGMTLTDVVFPAFLFITGLSIPLALGGRLRAGESRHRVLRHVFVRSAALIVIGVLMVNAEHGIAPGILSPDLWNVLMTLAVLIAWQAPSDRRRAWRPFLIGAGAVTLVALAFAYRSTEATGLVQLRPQWWGILGLIGWSYLVASIVYLLVSDRPLVLLAATALLYALYFADYVVHLSWLAATRPYLSVGSTLGSHAALVLSGTVVTAWMTRHRDEGGGREAFVWHAIGYGAAMVAAGWLLHQFRSVDPAFWISKPRATPAWCLISAGITCTAWAILYELVDLRGWRRWPAAVTIAGQNALVAYLLAPLLLSILALSAALSGGVNVYGALGDHLVIGTVRSILFAWFVVRLSGWLRARGVAPRL
jgi:heparan-alpha-glucosaminide N-acetyltransferase